MAAGRTVVALGIGVMLLLTTAGPVAAQRLPDGQPDVQGIWAAVVAGSVSLSNPLSGGADLERRITGKDVRLPSRIVDPPDGRLPYQPWAAAKQKELEAAYDRPTRPEHLDPQHRCLISGIPRLFTIVPPLKIVQTPNTVIMIWDEYHAYRVIPLDNRPHVASNVKLWMGDGRGRWEGNTLVIDTTNLRGARLDFIGDFHSDNARLTERLTFVDAKTMRYEATMTDPTVFTRPWTIRVELSRRPDTELWESACYEGNKDPDTWLLK